MKTTSQLDDELLIRELFDDHTITVMHVTDDRDDSTYLVHSLRTIRKSNTSYVTAHVTTYRVVITANLNCHVAELATNFHSHL